MALEGPALPRPPSRRASTPALRLRPRALPCSLAPLPRVRERPLRVRRRRGEPAAAARATARRRRPPRAVEARRVALRGGPALLRVRRAALGAVRLSVSFARPPGRRGPQFVALGGRGLERLAQYKPLLHIVEQGGALAMVVVLDRNLPALGRGVVCS